MLQQVLYFFTGSNVNVAGTPFLRSNPSVFCWQGGAAVEEKAAKWEKLRGKKNEKDRST